MKITNMVMIEDLATGKFLVQERVKSWNGLACPGGHVDPGESFMESAIREVKEETDLDVKNLRPCGVVHYEHRQTFERYLVFLYKTHEFSGQLIEVCEEGRYFWVTLEEFMATPSENRAREYVNMFLDDSLCEAFCAWDDEDEGEFVYR